MSIKSLRAKQALRAERDADKSAGDEAISSEKLRHMVGERPAIEVDCFGRHGYYVYRLWDRGPPARLHRAVDPCSVPLSNQTRCSASSTSSETTGPKTCPTDHDRSVVGAALPARVLQAGRNTWQVEAMVLAAAG